MDEKSLRIAARRLDRIQNFVKRISVDLAHLQNDIVHASAANNFDDGDCLAVLRHVHQAQRDAATTLTSTIRIHDTAVKSMDDEQLVSARSGGSKTDLEDDD